MSWVSETRVTFLSRLQILFDIVALQVSCASCNSLWTSSVISLLTRTRTIIDVIKISLFTTKVTAIFTYFSAFFSIASLSKSKKACGKQKWCRTSVRTWWQQASPVALSDTLACVCTHLVFTLVLLHVNFLGFLRNLGWRQAISPSVRVFTEFRRVACFCANICVCIYSTRYS